VGVLVFCLLTIVVASTIWYGYWATPSALATLGTVALLAAVGVVGAKGWIDLIAAHVADAPCPACHRSNPLSAIYCSHCGRQLRLTSDQPTPPGFSSSSGAAEISPATANAARWLTPRRRIAACALALIGLAAIGFLYAEWGNARGRQSLSAASASASLTPLPTVEPSLVVLSDNFSDPLHRLLPGASNSPYYDAGYTGGEYVIKRLDANQVFKSGATVPGEYDDAILRVSARLGDEAQGRLITTLCRWQGPSWESTSYYSLSLMPGIGSFSLYRYLDDHYAPLVEWQQSPVIHPPTTTNLVEMACVGDTISVRINGVPVAAAHDHALRRGKLWVGVEIYRQWLPGLAELHLSSLTVFRPPPASLPASP
jgi:hypothetical protein